MALGVLHSTEKNTFVDSWLLHTPHTVDRIGSTFPAWNFTEAPRFPELHFLVFRINYFLTDFSEAHLVEVILLPFSTIAYVLLRNFFG